MKRHRPREPYQCAHAPDELRASFVVCPARPRRHRHRLAVGAAGYSRSVHDDSVPGNGESQPEADPSKEQATDRLLPGSADNLAPIMRIAQEMVERHQTMMQAIISPALRAIQENAERRRRLVQVDVSPALRMLREAAMSSYARLQAFSDEMLDTSGILAATAKIQPWISKTAESAVRMLDRMHRTAAPPNWAADETSPLPSYPEAVTLALEEGIPVAWVPDHDTFHMLMTVRETGPARRAVLRRILEDRSATVLDHCQDRLDELGNDPAIRDDQKRMIDIAAQAVRALRAGLPAPAQSAAANLADQLLRRLFVPIHGNYQYRKTSARVESLSELVVTRISMTFLMVLRELATVMPVAKSLTEWWPDRGQELPDTFSRHATAHAISEPDQVNPVNALIAIMLAVSLLCQEAASGWEALRTIVWNPTDNVATG